MGDRVSVSLDQFRELTSKWKCHPVVVGGEVAGAVLVNGPDVHACVLPFAHRRWMGKWALELVNEIIDAHGYAQTHATTDAGRRFVTRMGFQPHGNAYRRTKKWESKQS